MLLSKYYPTATSEERDFQRAYSADLYQRGRLDGRNWCYSPSSTVQAFDLLEKAKTSQWAAAHLAFIDFFESIGIGRAHVACKAGFADGAHEVWRSRLKPIVDGDGTQEGQSALVRGAA